MNKMRNITKAHQSLSQAAARDDCQPEQKPQSEFVNECRKLITKFFETDEIPHPDDCYIECNNLFVKTMEKLKEACDCLETVESEKDGANKFLKKAMEEIAYLNELQASSAQIIKEQKAENERLKALKGQ